MSEYHGYILHPSVISFSKVWLSKQFLSVDTHGTTIAMFTDNCVPRFCNKSALRLVSIPITDILWFMTSKCCCLIVIVYSVNPSRQIDTKY